MPETPKPAGKEGEDAAFSFPVTPASEPPAAEPGSVFKTWPSFRKERKSGIRHWTQVRLVCHPSLFCSNASGPLKKMNTTLAFIAVGSGD